MSLQDDFIRYETRRQFFSRGKNVLGWSALASLLGESMTDKLLAAGAVPTRRPSRRTEIRSANRKTSSILWVV